MGTSLAGIEEVTRLLARCRVYEEFYLRPASKTINHASLKEAFVRLYGAVLEFLVGAKQYFDQSGTSRFSLSPGIRKCTSRSTGGLTPESDGRFHLIDYFRHRWRIIRARGCS